MMLPSVVDPADGTSQANEAHRRALAEELQVVLAEAAQGGPERSRRRHLERDELLPHDRVGALLDPGRPFLEMALLAAHGMRAQEIALSARRGDGEHRGTGLSHAGAVAEVFGRRGWVGQDRPPCC